MTGGQLRVGIGGWSYAPWRGVFYPPGLPQAREFAHAVAHVTAIEINATFYGRQSPKSWEAWGRAAPDGFKFAVKGSRYVVTRKRLAEAGEGIGQFLDQGLTRLGDRLGPVLWMLARTRVFDRDDIAAFLALLPDAHDGVPLRHVIEVRHDSFRNDAFVALARDRGVAISFDDDDDFPCIDEATADFRYARLQRMEEACPTGYPAADLDRWAAMGREWTSRGDAYLFMINGAKVRAPAAATAVLERLR